MIAIPLNVGLVCGFVFILFDVLVLALVDVILSHIVCALYYRNINRGKALSVVSVDIPGITTYLVGSFFSVINLLALAGKLIFIILIFFVNFNIEGQKEVRISEIERSATFSFDPSPNDNDFKEGIKLGVGRVPHSSRYCRAQERGSSKITYYHLAFDLEGGQVLQTEFVNASTPTTSLESESIVCRSPERVNNPLELLTVTGCSPLEENISNCADGTPVSRAAFQALRDDYKERGGDQQLVKITEGNTFKTVSYVHFNYTPFETQNTWDADGYKKPFVDCLVSKKGTLDELDDYTTCLLQAQVENGTLVEIWWLEDGGQSIEDDEKRYRLVRYLPGAVLEGEWDISLKVALAVLRFIQPLDWKELSGIIVAEAARYVPLDQTVEVVTWRGVVAGIPEISMGLAVFAFLAAIIVRFIVRRTLGKDDRPRINTIDGMSSIVREENIPTGGSYVTGREATMGLSIQGAGLLRFGPVRSPSETVARSPGQKVH